jgi:hypothetical protein
LPISWPAVTDERRSDLESFPVARYKVCSNERVVQQSWPWNNRSQQSKPRFCTQNWPSIPDKSEPDSHRFPVQVALACDTKFCSYEEVVQQIRQHNKRSQQRLGGEEEVEFEQEAHDGHVEPHAETWSILMTCPLSLTRMQASPLLLGAVNRPKRRSWDFIGRQTSAAVGAVFLGIGCAIVAVNEKVSAFRAA